MVYWRMVSACSLLKIALEALLPATCCITSCLSVISSFVKRKFIFYKRHAYPEPDLVLMKTFVHFAVQFLPGMILSGKGAISAIGIRQNLLQVLVPLRVDGADCRR